MTQAPPAARHNSIKTRMLAIALIPSLVLLLVGLALSGYLVDQGIQTYRWANALQNAVTPATRIVTDLQTERWLSLVQVGGGAVPAQQLAAQRDKVNADLEILRSANTSTDLVHLLLQNNSTTDAPWNQLGSVRRQVDSHDISLLDTYNYYDQLLAPIAQYTASVAADAPTGSITDAQLTAASLYSATEDVARANALSFSAAIQGGLTETEFAEYARQVGAYQSSLGALRPRMTTAEQGRYATLVSSPAWRQLTSVQDVLSARGPTLTSARVGTPLAVSPLDWQNDTLQVTASMLNLFGTHFQYAAALAADNGRSTLVRALIAGLIILLAGVAVLVVALRMSNGVSRRLARLREETLELAEQHLPRIVRRLRAGNGVDDGVDDIDLEADMPRLEHGTDEIGEVAQAFNLAQHTAVSAAVQEARTRQGANAVFLNIAHRSQAVAHRQLNVLDRAERHQDDPELVRLLFQLDHLATRARRNARCATPWISTARFRSCSATPGTDRAPTPCSSTSRTAARPWRTANSTCWTAPSAIRRRAAGKAARASVRRR
jgi:HAMP domain-containing protein